MSSPVLSASSVLDPLDRPYTVSDFIIEARKRGEKVSRFTIYRLVREGRLPVARCGRMTLTLRTWYTARTPQLAPAGRVG